MHAGMLMRLLTIMADADLLTFSASKGQGNVRVDGIRLKNETRQTSGAHIEDATWQVSYLVSASKL